MTPKMNQISICPTSQYIIWFTGRTFFGCYGIWTFYWWSITSSQPISQTSMHYQAGERIDQEQKSTRKFLGEENMFAWACTCIYYYYCFYLFFEKKNPSDTYKKLFSFWHLISPKGFCSKGRGLLCLLIFSLPAYNHNFQTKSNKYQQLHIITENVATFPIPDRQKNPVA